MGSYLCITTTFLSGVYHGKEWPPRQPARVMRAMLAGVMNGGYREQWKAAEGVLRWMERATPVIVAEEAREGSAYRIAVPNNDLDVAAKKWQRGSSYDPARLKTRKTVAPWRLAGSRRVHYLWGLQGDETEMRDLEGRARDLAWPLYSLGWGIDMAYADARILNESECAALEGERYAPADDGIPLETPVTGFVDDCLDSYGRFCRRDTGKGVNPDTRPRVYGLQPYRKASDTSRSCAVFTLRTLDGRAHHGVAWRDAMVVAAWMRHACGEAMRGEGWGKERLDSYVLGHAAEGGDPGDRLSYLPLPSVGHEHADGAVRRVIVAEPAGRVTGAMRVLSLKLPLMTLTDEKGSAVCRLARPAKDEKVLGFYLRRARRWRSVTPVILHGHNTVRGELSLGKTEKLLLHALRAAGLSEENIASAELPARALLGRVRRSGGARVPAHLDGRPRYHVSVEFRAPVDGPIAAGLGRHYGLGLMASEGD